MGDRTVVLWKASDAVNRARGRVVECAIFAETTGDEHIFALSDALDALCMAVEQCYLKPEGVP